MCTVTTISVPFPWHSLNPGPKPYTAGDFYHHSLTSIIHEKVLHVSNMKGFHLELYKLCWRHPEACTGNIQVYGEMYTSKAFLKVHQDLQDMPPELNCTPHVLVQCNSTHFIWQHKTLAPASILGNESKYN